MKKYIILFFVLFCWSKASYSLVQDKCSLVIQSLKGGVVYPLYLYRIYRAEKILKQDPTDIALQGEIAYLARVIGGKTGVQVLLKLLEQKPTDAEVQREIVYWARVIGGEARGQMLLKLLEQNPTDIEVQEEIMTYYMRSITEESNE